MQDYSVKNDDYFARARLDIQPCLPKHAPRVLEVGCGSGATLRWLKESGRCDQTVGIELFEDAAAIARAHVGQVLLGDAESLIGELEDGEKFDLVLCLDVLEHMVDPWAFMARLEGLVRPGGFVVASIPNVRHVTVLLPLLFGGHWRYVPQGVLDRTHLRFFTRETALELMTRPTLQVDRWFYNLPGPGSKSAIVNVLSLGLMKDFLTQQYLVASRKLAPGAAA